MGSVEPRRSNKGHDEGQGAQRHRDEEAGRQRACKCREPAEVVGFHSARAERERPEQRVQVSAVVRVPVADEDRVELVRGDDVQQPRHGGVAAVKQQPEPVVFHEVAAARPPAGRPRPAPPRRDSTRAAFPRKNWAYARCTTGSPGSPCQKSANTAYSRARLVDSIRYRAATVTERFLRAS